MYVQCHLDSSKTRSCSQGVVGSGLHPLDGQALEFGGLTVVSRYRQRVPLHVGDVD